MTKVAAKARVEMDKKAKKTHSKPNDQNKL
jgi:hypothetical protein